MKKRSFGDNWESADSLAGDRVSEKILGYLMDNLNGTAPSSRPFDVIAYVDGGRAKVYSCFVLFIRKGTDTTVKLASKCSIQDHLLLFLEVIF